MTLSRLMLGTVQFGMPYGVANRTGQPGYPDILAILAAAIEGGVNCFDTAAAYGTSEELLGRGLRDLGVSDRVCVVTKVRPLTKEEQADPIRARALVEKSIAESRQRLRLDCLPYVLFHREQDLIYREVIEKLQARGWVGQYGVSCAHDPAAVTGFLHEAGLAALQLPANVLDRRHQSGGVFEAAARQGVAVFIRSVYLQGLLVMPERDIPQALTGVVPFRRRLDILARGAGLSPQELALRYMLSQPGVTSLVVGVDTVQQLQENLALFARGELPDDLKRVIDDIPTEIAEELITHSMWPARNELIPSCKG